MKKIIVLALAASLTSWAHAADWNPVPGFSNPIIKAAYYQPPQQKSTRHKVWVDMKYNTEQTAENNVKYVSIKSLLSIKCDDHTNASIETIAYDANGVDVDTTKNKSLDYEDIAPDSLAEYVAAAICS